MFGLRRYRAQPEYRDRLGDIAVDLAELQGQTVRMFAGGTALAACAIVLYVGAVVDAERGSLQQLPLVMLAILLGATAAVARGVVARWPALAAALLVAGLLAAVGLAQRVYPEAPMVSACCLVVLAAVRLLDWPGGLAASLAATGVVALEAPSTPVAWTAILLVWATAWFAWLGTHAFHTVVAWSLRSYQQAHAKTEDARARQAELARVSRDLRQAYAQLARANEELERARLAAEDARRVKVEFATSVSHELRTPLNLVIGFSEMMVLSPHTYAGERLPDTYRGDVEAIYRNACHLSNLIDDVLDLSQIDARRLALRPEPFAVREVVDEAIASVVGLFDEKGLSISVACPPCLPGLVADRTRVRQVLMNLLANAARFTERGGVTISARATESAVEVSVADTGAGLPPSELGAIFTEFHQVGGSRERHTSGLGLAICKRLIEAHGGTIRAESSPGAGSTFTFSLPRVALATDRVPSWETWARAGRSDARPAIAVVGDDPDVLRVLRRHLRRYDVAAVGSVPEALALAGSSPTRAIFAATPADLDAARGGAARGDAPPGLAIVGCSLSSSQETARSLGAAAFLAKPVTRDRLRAALARLGAGARAILVVDDEPEMVRLLARMVRSEAPGCEVLRADGGRAALALLDRARPDAILLDLLMPDLDGYAVLDRLRDDPALRDIPVVVISAKGSDDRLVAGELVVTRRGGLPMTDLMRCLEASLDLLVGEPSGSAPAPRAARAG